MQYSDNNYEHETKYIFRTSVTSIKTRKRTIIKQKFKQTT